MNKPDTFTCAPVVEPKASTDYKRLSKDGLEWLEKTAADSGLTEYSLAVVNLIAEVRHLRQETMDNGIRLGHLQYYTNDLATDVHEMYGCDRLTELAEKMRAMAWGETELEDS